MAWTFAETDQNSQTFMIKAPQDEKLKSSSVKEVIHNILEEELSQFTYQPEVGEKKAESLAEIIQKRLTELQVMCYKFVVNVVLGEQRGGGIKIRAGSIWNTDMDVAVSETFLAETFFCSATVFDISFY